MSTSHRVATRAPVWAGSDRSGVLVEDRGQAGFGGIEDVVFGWDKSLTPEPAGHVVLGNRRPHPATWCAAAPPEPDQEGELEVADTDVVDLTGRQDGRHRELRRCDPMRSLVTFALVGTEVKEGATVCDPMRQIQH